MYHKDTIYVIGHGRTSIENAITEQFKIFFIGFVVDTENDEVVDLSCSATISTTEEFIASIFIGKKFDRYREELEEEVLRRYFGTSQKAITTAYKDALKKYREVKGKYY